MDENTNTPFWQGCCGDIQPAIVGQEAAERVPIVPVHVLRNTAASTEFRRYQKLRRWLVDSEFAYLLTGWKCNCAAVVFIASAIARRAADWVMRC
jgi:hypothetical protein